MRSYGARINFIKYMGDYAQSRGYAFGLRSRGPESAAYSGFAAREKADRKGIPPFPVGFFSGDSSGRLPFC